MNLKIGTSPHRAGQSLMEAKPADAVVAEDLGLLNKACFVLLVCEGS